MDLLSNDITVIFSLIAAALSVIAGALPFLKKSEIISLANILKKP